MEGVDMIKPEYVLTDHQRVLILDHVADADKPKLEEDNEQAGLSRRKWKKLKGQNKNRHRFRVPDDNQLCSQALQDGVFEESKCSYKKCRYLHSVKDYLKVKKPDLGDSCPVYKTKGKCSWGVACRFGSSHLDENGTNVENLEIVSEFEKNKALHTLNKITREQQIALRKREFDFSKTEKIIAAVDKIYAHDRETERNPEDDDEESKRTRKMSENDDINPTKKLKDESGSERLIPLTTKSSNGEENGHCELPNCEVGSVKTFGSIDDSDLIKLRPAEKKIIDWENKLYLAPLTTLGNLPFRRICKEYGADVTCSEMVMATSLLRGESKEWSLVRRHGTEDLYGVQIAGSNPYVLAKASQALREMCEIDFIDINLGCPLDAVCAQGVGCGMLMRPRLLKHTATTLNHLLDIPFTYKIRSGCKKPIVHKYMPWLKDSGVSLVCIHGRTREQRYTKTADWDYVNDCAKRVFPVPVFVFSSAAYFIAPQWLGKMTHWYGANLPITTPKVARYVQDPDLGQFVRTTLQPSPVTIGNGDILSYQGYQTCLDKYPDVSGVMIGRGALMKPWVFQEIKEKKMMDPSSSERFDMLKRYVNYGLEHWGSDTRGVENTRQFLLEWLSFLYRYVPNGILTNPPQVMNERPPSYKGRDDLETLMASPNAQDWVKISEMILGPAPEGFTFLPKHKSNAWK